jgi:hypothetical protein
MPRRSAVWALPEEVRAELDRRLVGSGFAHYEGLSAWLAEHGYQMSKSAVHRYGQELEESFERSMGRVKAAQALARAWTEADPDAQGALVDATARIAEEALLRITIALGEAEEDPQGLAKHMSQVSRALADLGRLTLAHRRHAEQVRREAAQALEAKVEAAAGAGRTLDAEAVRGLIREAYGV